MINEHNLIQLMFLFIFYWRAERPITMFFRKLLGNNDVKAEKSSGPPPGMQTMGANLQRRFAKGIQYNSKFVLFVIYHGYYALLFYRYSLESCCFLWCSYYVAFVVRYAFCSCSYIREVIVWLCCEIGLRQCKPDACFNV